jgi:serine protease Do
MSEPLTPDRPGRPDTPETHDTSQTADSPDQLADQPATPVDQPPVANEPSTASQQYGSAQTDHATTRYTPPPADRPPWTAQSEWPHRTPEHWLEPLPAQQPVAETRTERGRPGLGYLAGLVVIALLAGAIGSAVTYTALDGRGRSGLVASPSPAASPPVQLTVAPTPQTVQLDEQSAIIRAAESVSAAVVTITSRAGEATDPFSLPATGVGSGIIFDSAGWVLTNRHVVGGATQVTVELQDGRDNIPGTVYGEDTLTDLAIVKIEASDLPVADIGDSAELKPGQLAVAVGSPLGTFTNSVTSGIISALGRDVPVTDPVTGRARRLRNLIQTDAAINPGNSGGALADSAGRVVGVNTAVAGGAQGIGFAIPINIAKPIMRQAAAGEPLARPWIGISYVAIDRNVAEEENLSIDYGALVSSEVPGESAITPDSPAEQAGLEEGDIITAIGGTRIDATHRLDDILSEYSPGDRLALSVLRDGMTRQINVTLGTRPAGL